MTPGTATGSPRPLAPTAAISWMLLVYLALQWGLLVTPGVLPGLWGAGLVQLAVLGTATAALVGTRGELGTSRATLALRGTALSLVGGGLVLGIALHAPSEAVRALVEWLSPTPEQELVAQAALLAHDTWLDILGLWLVVVLAGPLVEELFYRGALFSRLRAHAGTLLAGAVTATGFVIMHPVRDWLALLPAAVAFTVLRVRSQSILPAFAAHAAFNGVSCAQLLSAGFEERQTLAEDPAAGVSGLSGVLWLILSLLAAVGLMVWLMHRRNSAD